jgi:thiamine transporter ThiT
MNKNDDFDNFLKSNFQKSKRTIDDDGFTQRVLSNLPANRAFTIKRSIILYLASIISVLVFFISSGYKSLLVSLIDIINNGSHLVMPSLLSFFVIAVFFGTSFYIAKTEDNKTAI